MKRSEIKQTVETYARGFAADSYALLNSGCSEDDAWRYSGRHWRKFVGQAIDFMAMTEAIAEAEAAPFN